jgi:hypothetical protein
MAERFGVRKKQIVDAAFEKIRISLDQCQCRINEGLALLELRKEAVMVREPKASRVASFF